MQDYLPSWTIKKELFDWKINYQPHCWDSTYIQICTTPGSGLGCVVYILRKLFGLELRMHFSRLKSVLFVVYDQYFISPITHFI